MYNADTGNQTKTIMVVYPLKESINISVREH